MNRTEFRMQLEELALRARPGIVSDVTYDFERLEEHLYGIRGRGDKEPDAGDVYSGFFGEDSK